MSKKGLKTLHHTIIPATLSPCTTAKIDPCAESVASKIEIFKWGSPGVSLCECKVELNYRNVFRVHQLIRVSSVWALGLDTHLAPCKESTVCGFMGLKLQFRGTFTLACSNVF